MTLYDGVAEKPANIVSDVTAGNLMSCRDQAYIQESPHYVARTYFQILSKPKPVLIITKRKSPDICGATPGRDDHKESAGSALS